MGLVPKNVLKFIKLLFNEPAFVETNKRSPFASLPDEMPTVNFSTHEPMYASRPQSGRYERGFRYGG